MASETVERLNWLRKMLGFLGKTLAMHDQVRHGVMPIISNPDEVMRKMPGGNGR